MEKFAYVRFKEENGKYTKSYTYLNTVPDLLYGDLVYVNSSRGVQLVEFICYSDDEDEKEDLMFSNHKKIIEKAEIKNGQLFYKGKPASEDFVNQYKKFEKKSFIKRIFSRR